jgi:hypothetical protein
MYIRDRRRGGDRRKHPRGGRRPGDRTGFAPLVFLVTREPSDLQFWEALLLDRQFAVVTCNGFGPALEASKVLRPDVILAGPREIAPLRDRLAAALNGARPPILELVSTPNLVEPVIEAIRCGLRVRQHAVRT